MHSVVNCALLSSVMFPEQGSGESLSTNSNQFPQSISFFYYLKGNFIKQIKTFYLVLFYCGEISLICLQWLGCATAWLDSFNHEALSIEYLKIFLLPFICLQFWVFSSCQCQEQSWLIIFLLSLKKNCYLECRISLFATFIPPQRLHIKAMKCQLGLQVWLLDKGFSPPGKYVELSLCFISRQPSKANWPELGDFSSVLIGEAENVWFSFGLCSQLK